MRETHFAEDWRMILSEVEATLAQVREEEEAALEEALLEARGVFVAGEGRSGLVARTFAMRLMHLGVRCYVAGETITPAAAAGDLLVAVSGTGATAGAVARAQAAREAGVRVAVVTGVADSPLGRLAERRLLIPAQESGQYGGSRFEQSALIVLDAIALRLQRRLRQSAASMDARHATLE